MMDTEEVLRRVREVEVGTKGKEVVKRDWLSFLIPTLIGTMVTVLVGISLLPGIMDAVKGAKDEAPGGLGDMVLPYIFGAVLILGTIAWFGFHFHSGRERREEAKELSEADEIRALQKKGRRHITYDR